MKTDLLQNYLQLARSDNADDREEAAREFAAFLQLSEVRSALYELLGDADWRVRRAAVETFVEARRPDTIPLILDALYEEENAGKRNAALDILARQGKEILPYLPTHLNSGNVDVLMFLINLIGDLRDSTYLDAISAALRHKEPNLVSAAILAAGKIGYPGSLAQILPFLHGNDLWLKVQAIEAAGEIQDPNVIPELIVLVHAPHCRKAVIQALSRFFHPDAYHALLQFVVSEDTVDADALKAITDIYGTSQPAPLKLTEQKLIKEQAQSTLRPEASQTLLRELKNESAPYRKQILELLGWSRSETAIPQMIDDLEDPELMETAARAILDCGKSAAPAVLQRLRETPSDELAFILLNIAVELEASIGISLLAPFLSHSVDEIRYQAFKLVNRNSTDAPEWLIRGIMDPHPPVNESCRQNLLALCKDHPEILDRVKPALSSALLSTSSHFRANAMEFLALSEPEHAYLLVLQALKDEESTVRRKAVRLLSSIQTPQTQKLLVSALADEDAQVRELAARALSQSASPEVFEALLSSLKDEDPWVRIAVYESLSFIQRDEIPGTLLQQMEREIPMAQSSLLISMGRTRNPLCKEAILRFINSADPEIRKSACEALCSFPENEIVFCLYNVLRRDADWRVRAAAIRSLVNIGAERLPETLSEHLHSDTDPFVRKEILHQLQKLHNASIPEPLFGFLIDPALADSAYNYLVANIQLLKGEIQKAVFSQPPVIRRILRTLLH